MQSKQMGSMSSNLIIVIFCNSNEMLQYVSSPKIAGGKILSLEWLPKTHTVELYIWQKAVMNQVGVVDT